MVPIEVRPARSRNSRFSSARLCFTDVYRGDLCDANVRSACKVSPPSAIPSTLSSSIVKLHPSLQRVLLLLRNCGLREIHVIETSVRASWREHLLLRRQIDDLGQTVEPGVLLGSDLEVYSLELLIRHLLWHLAPVLTCSRLSLALPPLRDANVLRENVPTLDYPPFSQQVHASDVDSRGLMPGDVEGNLPV